MALITVNEGKTTLLAWMMCEDSRTDFQVGLFSNDVTIDKDTVLADLTEATFSGYSSKSVARTSLTTPAMTADSAYTSMPSMTWTNSSGSAATVYGIYITASTTLLWAERFSPTATINASSSLTYTPTLWFGGCL